MHEGGIDTHDLAVAAGKQAEAAKAQSEQSKAQTEKMAESLAKTDDLIRQATDQAKATNRLAQQAKRQADIAVSTLEAEERPLVGIDHLNFPAKVAVDSILSSSLVYKNWGKGVAVHVMPEFQISAICEPFPKHLVYTVSTPPAPALIMPGQTLETGTASFPKPLTADDITALKRPTCGLYIYARITYRDRAGHQHWRHICGHWNPSTDNTFDECPLYNDGDEDYPDGKEP